MSLKRETRFEHEYLEDFEDGECIFEEGDTGRDLYIVQLGAAQILKKMKDAPSIEMAIFRKGDFFGDMALLQSLPRYASAYAKGKTKLLILKPAGCRALCHGCWRRSLAGEGISYLSAI